jgi:hypothetical protein
MGNPSRLNGSLYISLCDKKKPGAYTDTMYLRQGLSMRATCVLGECRLIYMYIIHILSS